MTGARESHIPKSQGRGRAFSRTVILEIQPGHFFCELQSGGQSFPKCDLWTKSFSRATRRRDNNCEFQIPESVSKRSFSIECPFINPIDFANFLSAQKLRVPNRHRTSLLATDRSNTLAIFQRSTSLATSNEPISLASSNEPISLASYPATTPPRPRARFFRAVRFATSLLGLDQF